MAGFLFYVNTFVREFEKKATLNDKNAHLQLHCVRQKNPKFQVSFTLQENQNIIVYTRLCH